jgi:hypothetical protein
VIWKDKLYVYICINHQHNATSAVNNGELKKSSTAEDYSWHISYRNKEERPANSYSIGEYGSGQKIFHLSDLTMLNHLSFTLWWQNRHSKMSSNFDSKFIRNECKGLSSSETPSEWPNSLAIQSHCSIASYWTVHMILCVLSQEEINNFSALRANLVVHWPVFLYSPHKVKLLHQEFCHTVGRTTFPEMSELYTGFIYMTFCFISRIYKYSWNLWFYISIKMVKNSAMSFLSDLLSTVL